MVGRMALAGKLSGQRRRVDAVVLTRQKRHPGAARKEHGRVAFG